MLIGRGPEQDAIASVLEGARGGRSGVLLVHGAPGIGKSALLGDAIERATDFAVHHVRAAEGESILPYAALHDLLQPVLPTIEELPAPQARALRGALSLAEVRSVEPFAVCAATLGVLTRAATRRPILVVVDDAQWLDPGSGAAILFVARRISADRIAILIAQRDDESGAFDLAGIPRLELSGLTPGDALRLLDQSGLRIGRSVAARMAVELGGNPLALLELPRAIDPDVLGGGRALDEPLPPIPSLRSAYASRIALLTPGARQALLIAAAIDAPEVSMIERALAWSGHPRESLSIATASGLARIDRGRVEFRHPIVASMVYHDAHPDARCAAHAALAAVLDAPAEADRRLWQLALAATRPDEGIAGALAVTAAAISARGAHGTAARAFEKAAALTPERPLRAERLVRAAVEAQAAGMPEQALWLLDDAVRLVTDPERLACLHHQRGRVLMWLGRPMEAHAVMASAARAMADHDPGVAAEMLGQSAYPCLTAGRYRAAIPIAVEAVALAHRALRRSVHAELALVAAMELAGHPGDVREHLHWVRAEIGDRGEQADVEARHILSRALMYIGDFDASRMILESLVRELRLGGALGLLSYPLTSLAELDFRTGGWSDARAQASEAVELAVDTGQASDIGLLTLALIEAGLGRADDCRLHVKQGRALIDRTRNEGLLPWAGRAIGLLELAAGNAERAVQELEPVMAFCEERGLRAPGAAQWEGDLIEAYVACGRRDEATHLARTFSIAAAGTGDAGAMAVAARSIALVGEEEAALEQLAAAMALHERVSEPFQAARTRLALGRRLRRARQRQEAVDHLRHAERAFAHLGALVWLAQAQAELRAAGERGGAARPAGVDRLTPQELQVALTVARGATNREAASELFLSEKTIESHLVRAYRKLGVRSRTELANVVFRFNGSSRMRD